MHAIQATLLSLLGWTAAHGLELITPGTLDTSVVVSTHYNTVESCGSGCPEIVTSVVEATTTVCPLSETPPATLPISSAVASSTLGFPESTGARDSTITTTSRTTKFITVDSKTSAASTFQYIPPDTFTRTANHTTAGPLTGTGSSSIPAYTNGSVTPTVPAYPTESVIPYTGTATNTGLGAVFLLVAGLAGFRFAI